jgi:hypothetical protein
MEIKRTETVATVKTRQVIWPDWMAQATEGLADSDLVTTYTNATGFGNYLMAIEPVEASA